MKRYLFIALGVVLTFTACKQDEYMLFNDIKRIQFGPDPNMLYNNNQQFADTTKSYTFYYEEDDVQSDTVFFDIYTVGGVANHDRTFALQQETVPDVTNAVPNVHYQAFDHQGSKNLYVIKANEVHAKVPVILLRDPSLKTQTVTLKFNVIANEHFQVGESTKLWRKVSFTDKLSKPDAWDNSMTQYFFGKYSVRKHQFMIETTGEKWDQEMFMTVRVQSDLLTYYNSFFFMALIDYNKQLPEPLRDEDGELIVFP